VEASPEQDPFFALHALWLTASVGLAALLYFRPRPQFGLFALILMHGLAFLGYYGNLPRTYAVGVSSDRALGVGMAIATALGGSPFNHVQVEFGNLEPLWTFTVAALSLFRPEFVPWVYDRMSLIVMTLTALGFYAAWSKKTPDENQDIARWRGVLIAAGVLGLSSIAMAKDPPIHHFWQGNFVFKPNHALAFGLVGLLSRYQPDQCSWLRLGLIQAGLIWTFILDWAYLLAGLFLAALLGPNRVEGLKRVVLGTAVGVALSIPYLSHLLRDYNPVAKGEMPQIWRDQMGDRLNHPSLWSTDLGPLLILFLMGLYYVAQRREEESGAFGFLLTGPLVAACYVAGLQFGFAPEPDEGFYYARLVAGAGAGYAIWRLASGTRLGAEKGPALAFCLILAVSYPAYFNPVADDRYFVKSSVPLEPPVLAAAEWISQNTGPDSVLISSEGIMLSGLTGRRFLMVRPEQTADRNDRMRAERDILTSLDETTVRRAALRYKVTHVVLDGQLREDYGDESRGLGNRPWFEPAFANSFARILILRP
jgi:hypothetical protein